MSNRIKYLIIAILSFIVGFIYYRSKSQKVSDPDFNKTLAKQNNGEYFLVFNSIVTLSKKISKEQYDLFLQSYPSGANGNVIDQFAAPMDKYTLQDGKYYEYKWNGSAYTDGLEITKEEYDFLKKKSFPEQYVTL